MSESTFSNNTSTSTYIILRNSPHQDLLVKGQRG